MLKHKTWLIDILSKYIHKDDAILLYGDVGSGKTTFIRQFCEKLGLRDVSSPTYTIANHYSHGDVHVIHSDLYRLNNVEHEVLSEIYSQDAIAMIEWAERIPDHYLIFFKNFIQISFQSNEDLVIVKPYGRFVTILSKYNT